VLFPPLPSRARLTVGIPPQAFVIMNCIFFFSTAILAWMHGGRMSSAERDRTHVRRSSHHRHGSRHGSRRSSHSHHRVYV